jgi:hypothetical protein
MKEENTEHIQAETRPLGSVSKAEPTENPDAERLRTENEDLKNELYMRTAAYIIEAELQKSGARSPKLLADLARASLQIGDDGQPANTAAVVEHLRRAYPEQFDQGIPTGSIDGGAGRVISPTVTKESLARMSPAEIQRLDWNDVRSALAN